MITRMSHAAVYVLDQDRAKGFYTEKLGFSVGIDQTLDGFRWLTVSPPDQDLEIALLRPVPPLFDEATSAQIQEILGKGAMSSGVLRTPDLRATHAELTGKGVEFLQEPTERPWGLEATFRDDSGNWFSLMQEDA